MNIVQYPAEILSARAHEIVEVDDKIRMLAAQMLQVLGPHNGVGLAAPQVGIPLRLIVGLGPGFEFAFANPELIKTSEQCTTMEEGCLSFRGKGTIAVRRPKMIKVGGITMRGEYRTFKARGLLAAVVQHEIDHLDGITLADKGLRT